MYLRKTNARDLVGGLSAAGRRLGSTLCEQNVLKQQTSLCLQYTVTSSSLSIIIIIIIIISSSSSSLNISKARFPFKRNRLRCVRCVNENHKKRKRLRWQAANHGCHCFDRTFLLAGACVCCVKFSRNKRERPVCKLSW